MNHAAVRTTVLALASASASHAHARSDWSHAELVGMIQIREAFLEQYGVVLVQHDREGRSAMPDAARLELVVRNGRYRWDIDFELGPDDRGYDLHATAATNGTEVLHWRRNRSDADLFTAPAETELQHILPKQNF